MSADICCQPCLLYLTMQSQDMQPDILNMVYRDPRVCLRARMEAAFQSMFIERDGSFDRAYVDSIKPHVIDPDAPVAQVQGHS